MSSGVGVLDIQDIIIPAEHPEQRSCVATLCPLPSTPARIAIGAAPWSEPSSSSLANATCRAVQYFPRRLSNALLQTLTAP